MLYREECVKAACSAKGPTRSTSSERNTTAANVRSAIAQCPFDLDGRVEFGLLSTKEERAILAMKWCNSLIVGDTRFQ